MIPPSLTWNMEQKLILKWWDNHETNSDMTESKEGNVGAYLSYGKESAWTLNDTTSYLSALTQRDRDQT